jgi:hypothetical protein
MIKFAQTWFPFLFLVVVVLLGGCGQRTLPQQKPYSVQGKVTYKGKPAQYVMVQLEPTDTKKGVTAMGRTDGEGAFELRTYANEGFDGAVPGEYTVTILEFDPVRVGGGPVPKEAVPTKIPNGSITLSDTIEIKAEDNELTLEVP